MGADEQSVAEGGPQSEQAALRLRPWPATHGCEARRLNQSRGGTRADHAHDAGVTRRLRSRCLGMGAR
jgi:hypothetical protein